jgi:hypothetical protein
LFDRIDENSDGIIDKQELQMWIKHTQHRWVKYETWAVVTKMRTEKIAGWARILVLLDRLLLVSDDTSRSPIIGQCP